MTQTVTPFLHTDLDAPTLLDYLRTFVRNGVVSGSQVSAGSSGWLISIGAGEVLIDSSRVADDLVKLDHIDLLHTTGQERHYAVYQSYAYTNSDPPATSPFAVTAAATPPSQPVIPAGAVKLADIWIPSTATSILHADVRIVNAPPLFSRQDTGELIDRLVMSVGNTQIFTDGSIIYDDGTGDLTLSQDVTVQVLVTTKAHEFGAAPSLVRGVISAGTYAVPGTSPNRDVILYAMINRSTPNDALPITLKFMDRNAPSAVNLTEILNPAEYTKFVCLGVVSGTRMHMPGVQGQLPQPVADERKFLQNRASGVHVFDLAEDTDIVGGLRANVADTTARDAIPNDVRKVGMVVYVVNEDRYYTLRGGTLDANWVSISEDIFMKGGFRVVADQAERFAIPQSKQTQRMWVLQQDDRSIYQLTSAPSPAPTDAADWIKIFQSGGPNDTAGSLAFLTELGGDPNGQEFFASMKAIGMAGQIAGHLNDDPTVFKSHMVNGMELIPAIDSSKPRATLKPGSYMLPNGIAGVLSADIHLDLGVVGSFVDEVGVPGYPSNVYVFIRRKPADGSPVMYASTAPPQANGSLSASKTPHATYVRDDYAYVGMLRPRAATGATYYACWGRFMVAHHGDGSRTIKFGEVGVDLTATVSQSLDDAGDHTAVLSPGGVSAASMFPTGIFVDVGLSVSVAADASGGARLTATAVTEYGGTNVQGLEGALAFSISKKVEFRSPIMSSVSNVYMLLERIPGSGNRTVSASLSYEGITENVNKPTHQRQASYGFLT